MKKNLLSFIVLLAFGIMSANAQVIVFNDTIALPVTKLDNAKAGAIDTIVDSEKYSGKKSLLIDFPGATATANWAMLILTGTAQDLTMYANGYLNFAMKTSSTNSFNVRITDGTNKPKIDFVSGADPYGFARDDKWHMVSIPIADIVAKLPALNLAAITDMFVFRSGAADGTGWDAATACKFYVDNVTISLTKATGPISSLNSTALSSVSAYPTIASNSLTINGVSNLKASIYSVTGQLVKSVDQMNNQLNVSDLSEGLYFISGISQGQQYTVKFIKK
jgi:hypothetical protein